MTERTFALLRAVYQATKTARDFFEQGITTAVKGGIDPARIVTEADVASEEAMLSFLRQWTDSSLGEETGFRQYVQSRLLRAIVDGIDGSRNYVHRLYQFFGHTAAFLSPEEGIVGSAISIPTSRTKAVYLLSQDEQAWRIWLSREPVYGSREGVRSAQLSAPDASPLLERSVVALWPGGAADATGHYFEEQPWLRQFRHIHRENNRFAICSTTATVNVLLKGGVDGIVSVQKLWDAVAFDVARAAGYKLGFFTGEGYFERPATPADLWAVKSKVDMFGTICAQEPLYTELEQIIRVRWL